MRPILSAAVVVSVSCGGAAIAQDTAQTIDGAHRFLQIAIPGSVYKGGKYFAVTSEMSQHRPRNLHITFHDPQVTSWTTTSKCIDHASISAATYDAWMDYNPARRYGLVAVEALDFDMNWSELVKVYSYYGEVRIQWRDSKTESVIYMKTTEMSDRVATAIEFLRKACDPTSNTGF